MNQPSFLSLIFDNYHQRKTRICRNNIKSLTKFSELMNLKIILLQSEEFEISLALSQKITEISYT